MNSPTAHVTAPKLWCVVPAAGSGRRFGADRPKQYLSILGQTIIEHTLSRLLDLSPAAVVVVIAEDDAYWSQLALSQHPLVRTAAGGAERCDSVSNALSALAGEAGPDDWVLVHDVARPCVDSADVHRLLERVSQSRSGGLLAAPVSDTLKRVEGESVTATEDRSSLWAAMTPQMFRFEILSRALSLAAHRGITPTDEAMAVELLGERPLVVEGRRDNIKITRGEDLALAETILRSQRKGNTMQGGAS